MRKSNQLKSTLCVIVCLLAGCQKPLSTPQGSLTSVFEEGQDKANQVLPDETDYIDALQGTWEVDVCSFYPRENGVGQQKDDAEDICTATFKGKTFAYCEISLRRHTAIGSEFRFTYSLDETKEPKEMDLLLLVDDRTKFPLKAIVVDDRTRVPLKAIYELESDTLLRIAIGKPNGKRPLSFSDDAAEDRWYLRMSRHMR